MSALLGGHDVALVLVLGRAALIALVLLQCGSASASATRLYSRWAALPASLSQALGAEASWPLPSLLPLELEGKAWSPSLGTDSCPPACPSQSAPCNACPQVGQLGASTLEPKATASTLPSQYYLNIHLKKKKQKLRKVTYFFSPIKQGLSIASLC